MTVSIKVPSFLKFCHLTVTRTQWEGQEICHSCLIFCCSQNKREDDKRVNWSITVTEMAICIMPRCRFGPDAANRLGPAGPGTQLVELAMFFCSALLRNCHGKLVSRTPFTCPKWKWQNQVLSSGFQIGEKMTHVAENSKKSTFYEIIYPSNPNTQENYMHFQTNRPLSWNWTTTFKIASQITLFQGSCDPFI